MTHYFTELLELIDKMKINVLDAYIAQIVKDKYAFSSVEEFEEMCSKVKDNYLKNEYLSLDDIISL